MMIIDSSVSKNFFGREVLLEALYGTCSNAKNGAAESVLLSGKRGIGKTKFLMNFYNLVFQRHDGVVPFFYTARKYFASAEGFANDYIGSFVLQGLAFQGNEPAVLSNIYSLEELREGAKEFGAQWAVDIIEGYLKVREEGVDTRTVFNALSAPYRSFGITGLPVIVIIDDISRIRKFCEPKGNDIASDFWMPFADSIRSMRVPHIFSGVPHGIEKVYFEETLMADHFEMMDLPGLDEADSLRLFRAVCDMYGMKIEIEPADFAGKFGGNPLYIKNFLQAARNEGDILSKEVFERTYYNEITRGMTYRYWTFFLKNHIHRPDLRKHSLKYLYSLSCGDPERSTDIEPDMTELISGLLHDCGSLETGFSETVPADNVLKDIITELYRKEIGEPAPSGPDGSYAESEEAAVAEGCGAPYVITIPADPKAGLVAIKSLEEIAKNYNIPLEDIGKMQLAMADLFSNVLTGDAFTDSCTLGVKTGDNLFLVDITTSQKDFVISEQDSARIMAYVDDLRVDGTGEGAVITLGKAIKADAAPPSEEK